jgi:hypothetical protein
MSVINEEEIFARIHKYKIFRNEGNLFIDVYEVILGKPAHKFMAVPNLLIQEADKKYFGVGDSKIAALKDCLRKIKDVAITEIVPTENADELQANPHPIAKSSNAPKTSNTLRKISGAFSRRKKGSMSNGL